MSKIYNLECEFCDSNVEEDDSWSYMCDIYGKQTSNGYKYIRFANYSISIARCRKCKLIHDKYFYLFLLFYSLFMAIVFIMVYIKYNFELIDSIWFVLIGSFVFMPIYRMSKVIQFGGIKSTSYSNLRKTKAMSKYLNRGFCFGNSPLLVSRGAAIMHALFFETKI